MPEATQNSGPTDAEAAVVVAGVVTDGAHTLFVADFNDEAAAWAAYQDLKSLEDGATVAIDGVVVVKRDADGVLEVQKATDHSTRSGLKWGLIGGVVLGVIFPPSIIGSAAVLGAAGAVSGELRARHHRRALADRLYGAIAPGHSGIVALVPEHAAVPTDTLRSLRRRRSNDHHAILESALANSEPGHRPVDGDLGA